MPDVEVVLQGYHMGSDQGRFGLAGVYLVRGSRIVLVDTAHIGRRELLLKRLHALQIAPSDIDVVVVTHAHWDHMFNVDLFPSATILLHQAELDYLSAPDPRDWATPPWSRHVLSQSRTQAAVDGQQLADGVWIVETPGHTWGSISVGVQHGDVKAAIVGDAIPNARSALLRSPYNVFAVESEANSSVERLLSEFSEFYPGHDRPFRCVDGKIGYLAESQLSIFGSLDPGDSDVAVRISAMEPPAFYRLDPAPERPAQHG